MRCTTMPVWFWRGLRTVLVLSSCVLSSRPAAAQDPSAGAHRVSTRITSQDVLVAPDPPVAGLPRTTWGAPDLGGIWDFRTLTPLERPQALADREFLTDEQAAEFVQDAVATRNADRRDGGSNRDVERAYNDFWWDWGTSVGDDKRTSLIVEPVDGRIPPLTAAARTLAEDQRTNWQRPIRERVRIGSPAYGPEDLGLSERCLLGFNSGPPMLPSAYNNNVHVLQTPNYVVLLNEMIHDARIVPLDGRPHLDAGTRQWMGDSRGYWEGDTLVVETTNFTNRTGSFNTLVASSGTGERLRLLERFTRVGRDRLVYEFTVDDPTTFNTPFTAVVPMRRTDGPLFEYACHEGNYGMTNLLAGARALEASPPVPEAGAR